MRCMTLGAYLAVAAKDTATFRGSRTFSSNDPVRTLCEKLSS